MTLISIIQRSRESNQGLDLLSDFKFHRANKLKRKEITRICTIGPVFVCAREGILAAFQYSRPVLQQRGTRRPRRFLLTGKKRDGLCDGLCDGLRDRLRDGLCGGIVNRFV